MKKIIMTVTIIISAFMLTACEHYLPYNNGYYGGGYDDHGGGYYGGEHDGGYNNGHGGEHDD